MSLTAYDILGLLHKVDQLYMNYQVLINEDGDYVIKFEDGFEDTGTRQYPTYSTVVINKYSECAVNSFYTGPKGTYTYFEMMIYLDELLKEQEQKRIKDQKRKDLIARLTDEEKELLGVK